MNIVVCRRRGEQNKILEKTPARVRKKKKNNGLYFIHNNDRFSKDNATNIIGKRSRFKNARKFFLSTISKKKIERDQQYTKILCYLPC